MTLTTRATTSGSSTVPYDYFNADKKTLEMLLKITRASSRQSSYKHLKKYSVVFNEKDLRREYDGLPKIDS